MILLAGHVLGTSMAASARPALTFLVVQVAVASTTWATGDVAPAAVGWLLSPAAMTVAFVAALIEVLAKADEDLSEILRELHVDHVLGAMSSMTAALLFVAFGADQGVGQPGGVAGAIQVAEAAGLPWWGDAGVVVAALLVTLAVSWIRGEIHEALEAVQLAVVWQRIEAGGVLVVLALALFSPAVGLVVMLVLAASLGLVGLGLGRLEAWADQRRRRDCPACAHRARVEATLCSGCGGRLEPTDGPLAEVPFRERLAALRKVSAP